jgi:aminoglycoside phosphotransferase (APT) family kinase protein
VQREHTIISALHPAGIPVARPLGLCLELTVNESPFYVMEFVDGAILRSRRDAERSFDAETLKAIGPNLASTLARIHQVDVDEVGLASLGRHEGYIERQLIRWRTQFDETSEPRRDYGRLIAEVGEQLSRAIPTQQKVAVVHGDYRVDNAVLAGTGEVLAILDWEISTLGDPLADVGVMLCFWTESTDNAEIFGFAPTTASGFISRRQVLESYAQHSQLDLSHIGYYQAFGFWKIACILQGVFARYQAGATAGDRSRVDAYPDYIAKLAELAGDMLDDKNVRRTVVPKSSHFSHRSRRRTT